jgi:predicted transcriptional regulator
MSNSAATIAPKKAALSVIKRMNERASYDDIMYEMYVLQKIERGEKDIIEGKTFTPEEAKKRLAKWLK